MEKNRLMKEQINREGRLPTDSEIKQIAKYNERMQVLATNLINSVLDSNPQVRNITQLERGRLAMEYIRMQEEPDNFMMLNRYLEIAPHIVEDYASDDEEIIHHDWTPFKYRNMVPMPASSLKAMGIEAKDIAPDEVRRMKNSLSKKSIGNGGVTDGKNKGRLSPKQT